MENDAVKGTVSGAVAELESIALANEHAYIIVIVDPNAPEEIRGAKIYSSEPWGELPAHLRAVADKMEEQEKQPTGNA